MKNRHVKAVLEKSPALRIPPILKLDKAGRPVKWIAWETAVTLEFTNKVIWRYGAPFEILGGLNVFGEQSRFFLHPVLSVDDQTLVRGNETPTITNRELFRRDKNLCLYCGDQFPVAKLSRDHIVPTCKNGANTWSNTVTSCIDCNLKKAGRTPEEARMPLLAVPYVPNHSEMLLLQNRKIIADQEHFLMERASKSYKDWNSRCDKEQLYRVGKGLLSGTQAKIARKTQYRYKK